MEPLNFRLIIKFCAILSLIFLVFFCTNSNAALTYQTYASSGSSPDIETSSPLTSGTVQNVNFDWGGGGILDSGRSDGVIVRFQGYYVVPGSSTQTFQFAITADDGIRLNINNQTVIDFWGDQGPTFRTGAITLTGGSVVPIQIDYYENGGGATVQWFWYNGGWQIVPAEHLEVTGPGSGGNNQNSLCCGGSAEPFVANTNFNNRIINFDIRPRHDTNVSITQIGNNNSAVINQSGTNNNYSEITVNGNSNVTNSTQSTTDYFSTNYLELSVIGNNNTVDLHQTGNGGTKSILSNITGNSNSLTIQQNDNGNHYAEINISGNNKSINLTQSGSADHMAKITLSGGSTSLTATQSGSIQMHYSINHNCAQISCAAITVTQGQ